MNLILQLVIGASISGVFCYQLSYYLAWWLALVIFNASVGVICLNLLWGPIKRYRVENEERDSLFPAFRRLDSPYKWKKWWFLPGAITLFPLRTIFGLGGLAFCCFVLKFIMFGYKRGYNEPLTGWRA